MWCAFYDRMVEYVTKLKWLNQLDAPGTLAW